MESTKIDKVPEPTLRRLPWYLSVCRLLKARGETFVSSTRLSKETNIVASQIAKDLSFVDVVGRTRLIICSKCSKRSWVSTPCTRLFSLVPDVWEARFSMTADCISLVLRLLRPSMRIPDSLGTASPESPCAT